MLEEKRTDADPVTSRTLMSALGWTAASRIVGDLVISGQRYLTALGGPISEPETKLQLTAETELGLEAEPVPEYNRNGKVERDRGDVRVDSGVGGCNEIETATDRPRFTRQLNSLIQAGLIAGIMKKVENATYAGTPGTRGVDVRASKQAHL
ncbi:hypothetical protein EVAR_33703_1 [Eumeta japonica]|uniref:Uncharacterized protein n=1 Tax=Eumeta variegata TaxID=151549 RepID=A0A4C1VTQ2_EUMVA|nr:hypothetical protein EVAR_33703_1 [Eumeta japonica]